MTFLVLFGCAGGPTGDDGGSGGGGASGGGGGSGGGGSTTGTGGGATGTVPELVDATAQVSSRTGRDLRLVLKGKDKGLDIVDARVRLMTAAGAPLQGLDSDRDGVADTDEAAFALTRDKQVGETFDFSVVIPGVMTQAPAVGKVGVRLVDAKGLVSGEREAEVVDQPVRQVGSSCDPRSLQDRCTASHGCRGTPPTCQEGLAPTVTRLAFYRTDGGSPHILIEGTEPEDDLASFTFTFRNAQGQPISVDSDGDGEPDMVSFEHDATGEAVDGTFFVRFEAGVGLDLQVGQLQVVPSDVAGHAGPAKLAPPSTLPVRASGQVCDPRGFDVCAAGFSCSPGIVGATNNRCQSTASMRKTDCTAAPLLLATPLGATLVGTTSSRSLWDIPEGCATGDPAARHDAVVKVRLADRASVLTLSTVGPDTSFDTTLYVLSSCEASGSAALACNDDEAGKNGASTITLTDMPAGDYFVIVDAFQDNAGGRFQLTATAQ